MPIYEYRCADCHTTFEKLRSMSQADAPAECVRCGSPHTSRVVSLFAALSKSSSGETHTVSGAGHSCTSCRATGCATCSH